MLLAEIKKIFHRELENLYPKGEIDSFFYQCVENYLGLERFVLVMQPGLNISKTEEQPIFEALSELKKEKPIQYIFGNVFFMGMELKVNDKVLIPRPETEELVQWVLEDISGIPKTVRILDIGTGSGCIAIALAKKGANVDMHALDISSEALEVARQNATDNDVSIGFYEGDILYTEEIVNEMVQEGDFDIIISNPPYVREIEKVEMHANVKKYEPSTALFVPDEDPLKFYRAIAIYVEGSLKKGGSIYFEINQYLAEETQALLEARNFFEIELRKDLFGNHRMIKAKKP